MIRKWTLLMVIGSVLIASTVWADTVLKGQAHWGPVTVILDAKCLKEGGVEKAVTDRIGTPFKSYALVLRMLNPNPKTDFEVKFYRTRLNGERIPIDICLSGDCIIAEQLKSGQYRVGTCAPWDTAIVKWVKKR